ncbi:MAG: NADH:ubiquinone oxidoreductase subunit NDUFA12 [Pseudobdellovibrionaceae bacterium]
MGLFSFLGVLSPIHINFVTLFSGAKKVGTDLYGNRYFEASPRKGYKRPRRWVMYKGAPDASAIPPEWHGWIHHQTDQVPSNENESFRRSWQRAPQPNLTGTDQAYHPKGHVLEGGKRDAATGDYEAWRP